MDVTSEGSSGPGTRIIKRYANRKLYDTVESRYVTLQQIAELVRLGEDVKIIDNTSKEDLTNVTLAQIIYEEEKKGESEVRKSSLLTFIQDGRDRLMTSLPPSISKLVRKEEDAKGEEPPDAKPLAAKPPAAKEKKSPLHAAQELKAMADDQVKAIVASAMGHVNQLQAEVRRLQGRIEELEAKIGSLLGRKDEKSDRDKDE